MQKWEHSHRPDTRLGILKYKLKTDITVRTTPRFTLLNV